MAHDAPESPVSFQTHPSRYRHWKLEVLGDTARLWMNVQEDGGLRPGYQLKQNSYDLGVDIELCDAVERLRFEHPEVKVVVVTSLRERIFCAGANIHMLGGSSHGFKVNFCKYTNETRLGLEDASAHSGLKFLCALNGTAAGGGYELALACDEILLVDDGSSTVSLPEVPLLAVLPGTGGLTRVVDKRKVRRDHADFFSTVAEGVRGKRAVEWRLIDESVPRSKFDARVRERAAALAKGSDRPGGPGVAFTTLEPTRTADRHEYKYVTLALDRAKRTAELTLRAPDAPQPEDAAGLLAAGCEAWAIRFFRELDDALLQLRMNEPMINVVALRSRGDGAAVLAVDRTIAALSGSHWLAREILGLQRRVLKRLDLTAKTLYALVDEGSCFSGTLFEAALACDRIYHRAGGTHPAMVAIGPLSSGQLPMSCGLSRLHVRFLADPAHADSTAKLSAPMDAAAAMDEGLATFDPDELDWDDEVRLAIEERASMSPDALTGLEANLRFAGPETMETKIFGRLTAWQNWIFTRPNATGERGALTLYGKAGQRADFDFRRT